ncbi:hypothetical protein HA44_21585 [Mixta gaviniae]|nr:hypothetical protein HA44_21585 [Mixta gaviniae]
MIFVAGTPLQQQLMTAVEHVDCHRAMQQSFLMNFQLFHLTGRAIETIDKDNVNSGHAGSFRLIPAIVAYPSAPLAEKSVCIYHIMCEKMSQETGAPSPGRLKGTRV